jgi:acetyl-CoA carboxylase biotin carboxyl carrier protein
MNEKYIKKLIRLVEESDIDSLEVKSWGRTVKITQRSQNGNGHGNGNGIVAGQQSYMVDRPSAPVQMTPTMPMGVAPPSTAKISPSEDTRLVPIKSPMVGTFYAAASPDAEPYVSLNQRISSGQVVCLVEAMKLMNEIESEVSGRVAKVMAENGKPVEFGQVLFLIDPD